MAVDRGALVIGDISGYTGYLPGGNWSIPTM